MGNSIRHKWDKVYHVKMIHHSLNSAVELDVKTVRFPCIRIIKVLRYICDDKRSQLEHDLSTSVNCEVTAPFYKDLIFKKLCKCGVL